jgi:WD40 repeat protein
VVDIESVQIVKAADGSLVDSLEGFTAPVVGMALDPQGDALASAYALDPYSLRFWDLTDGQVVRNLQGSNNAAAESGWALDYSPDGKYLAVRGDIWDLAAGEQLTEMEQAITATTSCWSTSVAFATQTDALATGCFGGQLDLWSVPDGALLKRIGGYSSSVDDLAYSPDGNTIAAIYGVPDYLVQVWKVPSGASAFTLTGGHFTRVSYSADGSMLATVRANEAYDQYGHPAGFVQMWSGENGDKIRQLDLDDAVSLAFSPDGQILATGSFDGTLRLWEVANGKLLVETRVQLAPVQRLLFTRDGTRLISGSSDGTISLWGIPQ